MGPAVRHLISLVFFEGIVFLWYYLETPLWHSHMAWMLMVVGVLFGEIVGRLIVAHLCHEDIPFLPRPIYALALPLVNATLTRVTGVAYASPELVAIIMAGLVLLSYGHFVSTLRVPLRLIAHFDLQSLSIINEICGLLKINCLSLTPAQLQAVRLKTKQSTQWWEHCGVYFSYLSSAQFVLYLQWQPKSCRHYLVIKQRT